MLPQNNDQHLGFQGKEQQLYRCREKVDIESASPRCAKGRKSLNLSAVDGGKISPLLPLCDTEIVIKPNKMSKLLLHKV